MCLSLIIKRPDQWLMYMKIFNVGYTREGREFIYNMLHYPASYQAVFCLHIISFPNVNLHMFQMCAPTLLTSKLTAY
jgi:uncharacterized membrane protein YbjE (DUF340 family)